MSNYNEPNPNNHIDSFLKLYDTENDLQDDLDLAIDMLVHYCDSVYMPKNVNRIFAMVHLVRRLGRQGFLDRSIKDIPYRKLKN